MTGFRIPDSRFQILLLLCALLAHGGCAALPGRQAGEVSRADAQHPVTQILCLWQPAEGTGLDQQPSRGVAGQIVFLTADSPTPVEVDGDVQIFMFDDQGPPAAQARPLHVFRFVDGAWQTHLKQTAWGPTYQVFVPYVRPGDQRVDCSLCLRLDPPAGSSIASDLAHIMLEGRRPAEPSQSPPPPTPAAAAGAIPASRPASPAAPPPRRTPRFETFSIPYVVEPAP